MRQHLLAVLEQSAGNISHAAARLGIARNTLYARLEKYGVRSHHPPPRRSESDPRADGHTDPVGTPRDHAALRRPRRGGRGRRGVTSEPGLEGRDRQAADVRRPRRGSDADERRGLVRGRSGGGCATPRCSCRDGHSQESRARREDKSRTPGVKIGIHVAQVLVGRSARPDRHRRGGRSARSGRCSISSCRHRDGTRRWRVRRRPHSWSAGSSSCRSTSGRRVRSSSIGSRGRNAGGWACGVR